MLSVRLAEMWREESSERETETERERQREREIKDNKKYEATFLKRQQGGKKVLEKKRKSGSRQNKQLEDTHIIKGQLYPLYGRNVS